MTDSPPHSPGAYFFFLAAFLAFFFAATGEIPPFGPNLDEIVPPFNMSGDKGLDILGVG